MLGANTVTIMSERTCPAAIVLFPIPEFNETATIGTQARDLRAGGREERTLSELARLFGGPIRNVTWDGGTIIASKQGYCAPRVKTIGVHDVCVPILYPQSPLTPDGNMRTLPPRLTEPERFAVVSAGTSPQQEVVKAIAELTGLSRQGIAALVGVRRPTIYAWLDDSNISEPNLRRLLATYEVLQRASTRHQTQQAMRAWLHTPRGADALTPASLLAQGEFGRARLLALSTAPPRSTPTPTWTREATPNAWTVREQNRLERVDRGDEESIAALLSDDEDDTGGSD